MNSEFYQITLLIAKFEVMNEMVFTSFNSFVI